VAETPTVAVVGLGGMGSRIAGRLLEAGYPVHVWNRSADKTAALADAGAVPVVNPAEAARRADAVLTMLADPAALWAVVEGPEGIAAGIAGETTLIEMSTVGPAAVRALASVLPHETALLDAPVLGSLSEVEAGALEIFVGGREDVVARWTPLLSVLGTPVHLGPLGAGAAAKLVANAALLGTLALLGETLALAGGLGVSTGAAFDLLDKTPLAAQATRRREAVEKGAYPQRFALSLARKDAELITDAAASSGVELRLATAVRSWLADAERAGWGERDYAALLAWLLEREGAAGS
jgi:3-hydroxyisobutyrate dehydrogenase-like beta-hydroxyacid dehydrogenase